MMQWAGNSPGHSRRTAGQARGHPSHDPRSARHRDTRGRRWREPQTALRPLEGPRIRRCAAFVCRESFRCAAFRLGADCERTRWSMEVHRRARRRSCTISARIEQNPPTGSRRADRRAGISRLVREIAGAARAPAAGRPSADAAERLRSLGYTSGRVELGSAARGRRSQGAGCAIRNVRERVQRRSGSARKPSTAGGRGDVPRARANISRCVRGAPVSGAGACRPRSATPTPPGNSRWRWRSIRTSRSSISIRRVRSPACEVRRRFRPCGGRAPA